MRLSSSTIFAIQGLSKSILLKKRNQTLPVVLLDISVYLIYARHISICMVADYIQLELF